MMDLGKYSRYITIIEGDPIEIQVANTEWHGPFEQYFHKESYKRLPADSSDVDIQTVVDELLKDKKYFRK